MKHRPLAVVLVAASLTLFTIDLSAQRRRGLGGMTDAASWAPDGVHVVYRGAWYDAKTWQKAERVVQPAAASARSRAAGEAGFAAVLSTALGRTVPPDALRRAAQRSTLPRPPEPQPGVRSSADGKVHAVALDGVLWAWREGGKPRVIAEKAQDLRQFAMAPDGRAVSFIRDHDLFVARTDTGQLMRLTQDGGENTFNGELDWVYQEEVYGRGNFQASWWSPSGAHLAFMRIDEDGVDTFSVIDHIPDQLGVEQIKYPKAGRTNPRATLHIGSAETGKVVAVDLSKYEEKDEILIVRVGWTPDGTRAVCMVQNRIQSWLDLDFVDPATGKLETVIHEESSDSWVERLPMPRWLANGDFIWESDRTGYRHFYRYGSHGQLRNAITRGEWDAGAVIHMDEAGGWMGLYGTTPTYDIGQNAYYATLDGSTLKRVTKGRGNHRVSFNRDGTMVLDAFENLENAGEQWLRTTSGEDVRKVFAKAVPEGNLPKWEQIKARDGERLDVVYTLPADFDPAKKYPVFISTYSGPAAPSVRDGWRGTAAGRWYVGLAVNVRSATQRGIKFTKKCYKQFGVQELRDIEDAVDWLCSKPWADASRVGITGSSYGGFMTAFALTHSDKFKCGIAESGVYAWELYDTIYTERYMQTPQLNPEGYRASSVIAAAKDLKGRLLIVHGVKDDNVHAQNAIQFIHALQQANKQNFELMLYPKARHGIRSAHYGKFRDDFLRRNL